RGNRGLRSPRDGEVQLCLDVAFRQQTHPVARASQNAGGDQRRAVNIGARLNPARVDRRLNAAQIDDVIIRLEEFAVEPALRNSAMERRLAAFETVDRIARARRLAFATAP